MALYFESSLAELEKRNPGIETAFKRIDARTSQAVLSHAGQVFGVARRVISEDGQTMTITFRREASTIVNNVAVYRKDQKR